MLSSLSSDFSLGGWKLNSEQGIVLAAVVATRRAAAAAAAADGDQRSMETTRTTTSHQQHLSHHHHRHQHKEPSQSSAPRNTTDSVPSPSPSASSPSSSSVETVTRVVRARWACASYRSQAQKWVALFQSHTQSHHHGRVSVEQVVRSLFRGLLRVKVSSAAAPAEEKTVAAKGEGNGEEEEEEVYFDALDEEEQSVSGEKVSKEMDNGLSRNAEGAEEGGVGGSSRNNNSSSGGGGSGDGGEENGNSDGGPGGIALAPGGGGDSAPVPRCHHRTFVLWSQLCASHSRVPLDGRLPCLCVWRQPLACAPGAPHHWPELKVGAQQGRHPSRRGAAPRLPPRLVHPPRCCC
mmetsp:Transcript_73869/g.139589  ORF Transcript_73869/g.139589 Transcript_73869/m.139589 type:complete len:349 (+) Transcript_73869:121-1167(+)